MRCAALTKLEKDYLFEYHLEVYLKISPYLNKNQNETVIAPRQWFSEKRAQSTYYDWNNYLKHRIPQPWKII